MAGLEPANAGVKVPCLTTWLHPNREAAGGKGRSGRSGPSPRVLGWVMGLEPTIFGTTIRRVNQLRYTHHIELRTPEEGKPCRNRCVAWQNGTPGGTRTPGPLLRRQLLYPPELQARMERVMGIEPTRPAWKAGILPLNYTRTGADCQPKYDTTLRHGLSTLFFYCFPKISPDPGRRRRMHSTPPRRWSSPGGEGRAPSG